MDLLNFQNIAVLIIFIFAAWRVYKHFSNALSHKAKSSSCSKCASNDKHHATK